MLVVDMDAQDNDQANKNSQQGDSGTASGNNGTAVVVQHNRRSTDKLSLEKNPKEGEYTERRIGQMELLYGINRIERDMAEIRRQNDDLRRSNEGLKFALDQEREKIHAAITWIESVREDNEQTLLVYRHLRGAYKVGILVGKIIAWTVGLTTGAIAVFTFFKYGNVK